MCEKTNVRMRLMLLLPLFCLSGCLSDVAMKRIHVDYAKAYADSSNQQLLLNLARLANSDPVHFMQLASISSGYTFTAGAGFSPSYVNNSPGFFTSGNTVNSFGEFLKHSLTLGGSATAGATENPIFQFIPLTGSNLVDAVLTPIPENMFYTFYDQNWPADIVARTMLESVQHAVKSTNVTTDGSMPFKAEELTDVSSIVKDLTNTKTALSGIVWTDFTNKEFTDLSSYKVTDSNADQIRIRIAQILNGAIGRPKSIYDLNKLASVPLRPDTIDLLKAEPKSGRKLARLNRLLLEDASTNLPRAGAGASVTTNYEYWVNDPIYATYPDFLNFCSMLRHAQASRTLGVDQAMAAEGAVIYSSTNAKLTDVVAAVQANLNVKYSNDTVSVSKPKSATRFVATPDNSFFLSNGFAIYTPHPTSTVMSVIIPKPEIDKFLKAHGITTNQPYAGPKRLHYSPEGLPVYIQTNVFSYLSQGHLILKMVVTIETNIISDFAGDNQGKEADFRDAKNVASEYADSNYAFKLRTVEAAMYTIANEEGRFRDLAITGPAVSTFSSSDTKDLSTLAIRLANRSGPLSIFLWAQMAQYMSRADRQSVETSPESRKSLDSVRDAVNEVITGGVNIYDTNRFQGISLRPLTVNLLQQNPKGRAGARLTRLLLEDAYPELPRVTADSKVPPYANAFFRTDENGPYAIVTRKQHAFWPSDITDTTNFAGKLLNASTNRSADPVSYGLWTGLPPDLRSTLTSVGVAAIQGENIKIARDSIASNLNILVNGPSLSNQVASVIDSKGKTMRPETTYLLGRNPTGNDLKRLNLLLLQDYYPGELAQDSRFKVRPLMTLTRRPEEGERPPLQKLAEICYYNGSTNQTYYVGDPKGESQDQVVFTMLSYLFAQTAVSTQNLPVQQTIRSQ
jgi:hypothetical protein